MVIYLSLFQSLPQETTPICWLVPWSMVIYLSLFQSLPQETTPICWLVPWSIVIYLSLFQSLPQETTPICWLVPLPMVIYLSISEPATRNYTNMLACVLVYGYSLLSISDACLTADPGVASSFPTRVHTLWRLIMLSVTSESMCTKYWLTACSSLPRKSVVRSTDRPAMAIAVDLRRKATKQTNSLYFRASSKKLHQYVGLCPFFIVIYLSLFQSQQQETTPICWRVSWSMVIYLSLFQSQQQETTPICWLVPWSMVIYLSISEPAIRNYTNMLACALVYVYLPLYFRACHKKLHQYVGLCPGLWLFTSLFQSLPQETTPICWLVPWSMGIYLSISEPAIRNYTNMLACALVYGYLPLYFRASSKKLHQYVGLCPVLWLFTSLFQSLPQETTPICWLVSWSMVIYLSLFQSQQQETTPICWLVPWSMVIYLSISEPAIRNYTNMLACALFYGYLPLYFRACHKKLHQYVGLCPVLWLFTSLYFRACYKKLHQYVGLCPGLWLFTSLFQSLP